MTGEKNRGASLEKLWNLDDKLLTTPKHDELVLSVDIDYICQTFYDYVTKYNDPRFWYWPGDKKVVSEENALYRARQNVHGENPHCVYRPFIMVKYYSDVDENVIRQSSTSDLKDIPVGFHYNPDELREYRIELKKLFEKYKMELDAKKKEELDYKIRLDAEVIHQVELSKNTVMQYNAFVEFVRCFDPRTYISITHEVPINSGSTKFIVGYWDIIVSFDKACTEFGCCDEKFDASCDICQPPIYIEAKPYIDSYGAVIRQIQTYRNYIPPDSIVCLLTPDSTFNKAFEQQGIKVISPC